MREPADGLLLLDKPRGPTSHDIVAVVRRLLQARRVGHGGTLDPWASGLLPLLLGRATRLARFLPQSPKVYCGTLQLGWTSTTDDVTGEPLSEPLDEGRLPDRESVLAAAGLFLGAQMQRPPAFSARRIDGIRSYRLARKGVPVVGPATPIEVFRFELTPGERLDTYGFEVEVSSGTYIRSLARDLGHSLGCGGVLASLVRTRIGPMQLGDALAAGPELDRSELERSLVPLDLLPLTPPPVHLDAEGARRFRSGGLISSPVDCEGTVRVIDDQGRLLGVAEKRDGLLQPRVVLWGPP